MRLDADYGLLRRLAFDIRRTKTSSSSGVDIMDNGSFRSTYDILKDIALVWDELADKNKASLLELIAGKNRSNYASAVIQNIGTAINSLDTSKHSDGSALKEHEKYIDSIEGKVKQFQAQCCLLYTSPSPRDGLLSRMPSSA